MVRAGHVAQSRITEPGFGGAAETTADAFSGTGAGGIKIHRTAASAASAPATNANRTIVAAGPRRDPNRGTSENCAGRLDLGAAIGAYSRTSIRAVGAAGAA